MSTPNYVIELMPTDALINHANALQTERKELLAKVKELETEVESLSDKLDYAETCIIIAENRKDD